jgi:hypothetical protein
MYELDSLFVVDCCTVGYYVLGLKDNVVTTGCDVSGVEHLFCARECRKVAHYPMTQKFRARNVVSIWR